jgi:putative DNA primase/helicase
MSTTSIPAALAELQRYRQWVSWRYEERDGRRTKVPYSPISGAPADSTDPQTWASYSQAAAAMLRYHHDGIGFVLTAADPFVGVDMDDCLTDTGQLTEWAAHVVRDLASYTEITPSGHGLRIFCRGTLPPGRRKRPGREMYEQARFLTVTGRHWPGSPDEIADRSAALSLLHAQWWPPPPPRPAATNGGASPAFTDDQVISKAKAAKNGAKFTALFAAGDTSAYGDDDSSADLALCALFSFYTQDRTQIDRLFRQSKLYRAKWERADYRDRTIDVVLSDGGEHYTGPRPGARPAVPVVPYRPADPPPTNGTPPPDAPGADEVTPFDADGEHLSDLGNAARLVRMHGADLRYARGLGWLVYEGGRWVRDTTGGAMRAAKATVRGMYHEAGEIADEAERKAWAKWALQSENAGRLTAMLTLAESEKAVACTTDDFDADPYLLNCRNGTLNLRTGELHPHDRADLITKQAPIEYDPAAPCPAWRTFLARIFEPAPDVIPYLQRAIGYALTGDTSEQVMLLLYGTGMNGKSTLLQTLAACLGDYAQATPAATLMVRDRNNNATNDLARMAGARLVTAIESDEGKRLAEGLIKQMTGGDKIVARYLHQEFFEFTPQFKLLLATNHKPIIRGTDYAIWRRIHLVPFLVTIPPEERDPYLAQRLAAEAPGILAWAVEGYQQFAKQGLLPPAAVTGATSDYRAEMDLIAAFLDECCVAGRTALVAAGALYAAYKAWAEDNGERPITQRAFSLRLQERGYRSDRSGAGGKLHWFGLGLISHAE